MNDLRRYFETYGIIDCKIIDLYNYHAIFHQTNFVEISKLSRITRTIL